MERPVSAISWRFPQLRRLQLQLAGDGFNHFDFLFGYRVSVCFNGNAGSLWRVFLETTFIQLNIFPTGKINGIRQEDDKKENAWKMLYFLLGSFFVCWLKYSKEKWKRKMTERKMTSLNDDASVAPPNSTSGPTFVSVNYHMNIGWR